MSSDAFRDQYDAAVADAKGRLDRSVARGARYREIAEGDLSNRQRELFDLFQKASADARSRYVEAVGEAEARRWPQRARWGRCGHESGVAVVYWFPVTPDALYCKACAEEVCAVPVCMACGELDDNLTRITLQDPDLPVLLGAMVCDDCYPEGADAPRLGGKR